jgi:hypothetical protein
MAGKGTFRVILCGALMGLTVGLLVAFSMFMTGFLAAKAKTPEVSPGQKQQSFMAMARDEWSFKLNDPDSVLGRIAVVQIRTGDFEGAKQTIEKIQGLDRNTVNNVGVYDRLYNKVSPTTPPDQAVIDSAKTLANSIQDPLLKADALRRVAEIEERISPDAARATLKQAAGVVTSAPPPEPPPPFNYWTLLWPAALTIFGLVFGALAYGLFGGGVAVPAKPKTRAEEEEDEEEEEEDEEEEKEEKADVDLVSQAPEPVAEEPVAPPPPPAPARAPAGAPSATRTAPPAPQPASQLAAAQPQAGMSAEEKKTMMAKQAQATMLAKQAQATMLAKQASKPTQIAPPDQVGK